MFQGIVDSVADVAIASDCVAFQVEEIEQFLRTVAGEREENHRGPSTCTQLLDKLESLKLSAFMQCTDELPSTSIFGVSLEGTVAHSGDLASIIDEAVGQQCGRLCELLELLSDCKTSTQLEQLHAAYLYSNCLLDHPDVGFALELGSISFEDIQQHFNKSRKCAEQSLIQPDFVAPPFVYPGTLEGLLCPIKHIPSYRFAYENTSQLQDLELLSNATQQCAFNQKFNSLLQAVDLCSCAAGIASMKQGRHWPLLAMDSVTEGD